MSTLPIYVQMLDYMQRLKLQGTSHESALQTLEGQFPINVVESQALVILSCQPAYLSRIHTKSTLVYTQVLSVSYGIGPVQVAYLLKTIFNYDATAIAQGLAYMQNYELTTTQIAEIIHNPLIYPDTTRTEMRDALEATHKFNEVEINQALDTVYGEITLPPLTVTRNIPSNPEWIDMDLPHAITSNQTVTIIYKSGRWTANPTTGYVDAAGNRRYRAKPGYTYPGEFEGKLIGRIGDYVFPVGLNKTETGRQGNLELTINDDEQSRYGNGYNDNLGAIQVEITVSNN